MFVSSKDIINIVLAFAILWLAIFMAWAIYYLAMILKEFRKIIADFRKTIDLVEGLIIILKEKLEHTSSYMKLLVETAVNVADFIKTRKVEKKTGKKKK